MKSASQTMRACCWPGCVTLVPRSMWGCKAHWVKLPKAIRNKIWRHYQPGQEETGEVSSQYAQAHEEALEWIKDNHTIVVMPCGGGRS